MSFIEALFFWFLLIKLWGVSVQQLKQKMSNDNNYSEDVLGVQILDAWHWKQGVRETKRKTGSHCMRLQVNAKDVATSPALFESTCDWESTEQKRLSVVIELTAMHFEFEWICLKRTVVLKSEEFHLHIFFCLC